MNRARWVPLALLGLTLAELGVFIGLGSLIGYGLTLLLVAGASVLGLVLVRREGLRAWRGFRETVAAGAPPGHKVTDGLVGLAGAMLLASPGLISSLAGAVLLLPPVRGLSRRQVESRAERRMSSTEAGQVFGPRRVRAERGPSQPATTDVVEGEVVE